MLIKIYFYITYTLKVSLNLIFKSCTELLFIKHTGTDILEDLNSLLYDIYYYLTCYALYDFQHFFRCLLFMQDLTFNIGLLLLHPFLLPWRFTARSWSRQIFHLNRHYTTWPFACVALHNSIMFPPSWDSLRVGDNFVLKRLPNLWFLRIPNDFKDDICRSLVRRLFIVCVKFSHMNYFIHLYSYGWCGVLMKITI